MVPTLPMSSLVGLLCRDVHGMIRDRCELSHKFLLE